MMRGTFGNIRIKNEMLDNVEGGYTIHVPSGEQMAIFDAAMKYQDDGQDLVVIAGKEYGTGSSRDWAAKGTILLGVKAVVAESYERIHRSNLIGMGVLPLQFRDGEGRQGVGLTGEEVFAVHGIRELRPGAELEVTAEGPEGVKRFTVVARVDTPVEVDYYRNGGILRYVLRHLAADA
jgi:aconitate hydratase